MGGGSEHGRARAKFGGIIGVDGVGGGYKSGGGWLVENGWVEEMAG